MVAARAWRLCLCARCGSSDSYRWRTWEGAGPGAGSVAQGLVLLAIYIWLVLTGYLLYYAGSDAFRAAVSLGHWTVGLAALFFLLLHRRIRRSSGARH
jgi:hypothetical protein